LALAERFLVAREVVPALDAFSTNITTQFLRRLGQWMESRIEVGK
jgi:hypothetical protein